MDSKLSPIDQIREHRIDYFLGIKGIPESIIIRLRYGDSCHNDHNSFGITADVYEPHRQPHEPRIVHRNGKTLWLSSCGCQHETILKRAKRIVGDGWSIDISQAIKFHLCSTDGPMHYIANTLYHVENRNLEYARISAIWPEATKEELFRTPTELNGILRARLPKLMGEFHDMIVGLGFTY